MGAILTTEESLYLGRGSTDLHQIKHGDAYNDPLNPTGPNVMLFAGQAPVHIGASWQMWLNRPYASAIRRFVKLL